VSSNKLKWNERVIETDYIVQKKLKHMPFHAPLRSNKFPWNAWCVHGYWNFLVMFEKIWSVQSVKVATYFPSNLFHLQSLGLLRFLFQSLFRRWKQKQKQKQKMKNEKRKTKCEMRKAKSKMKTKTSNNQQQTVFITIKIQELEPPTLDNSMLLFLGIRVFERENEQLVYFFRTRFKIIYDHLLQSPPDHFLFF